MRLTLIYFKFGLKFKKKHKQQSVLVYAIIVCRLYRERLSQVNTKLAEVEAGRAAEYLEPLAVLLENMQVRTKVAGNFWHRQTHKGVHTSLTLFTLYLLSLSGIYRELCLESVKNKYDCEIQAACQHWEVKNTQIISVTLSLTGSGLSWVTDFMLMFCTCVQSEKLLLFDTVQSELEEKIRRLEEDRHSIDITSGKTVNNRFIIVRTYSFYNIFESYCVFVQSCGMMR